MQIIKQFTIDRFGVKYFESDKYKGTRYGASFKPDPKQVLEYRVYCKNETVLLENVLYRLKTGSWKKD